MFPRLIWPHIAVSTKWGTAAETIHRFQSFSTLRRAAGSIELTGQLHFSLGKFVNQRIRRVHKIPLNMGVWLLDWLQTLNFIGLARDRGFIHFPSGPVLALFITGGCFSREGRVLRLFESGRRLVSGFWHPDLERCKLERLE